MDWSHSPAWNMFIWAIIIKNRSLLFRSYPGQFRVSRFEVLAREPRTETAKLLLDLGIQDIQIQDPEDGENITQDPRFTHKQ